MNRTLAPADSAHYDPRRAELSTLPAWHACAAAPAPGPVIAEATMMFLDCPAYLDREGAQRCGLPAEVSCRFTMRSSDGPLESAMISCPAGHHFTGAIESLTWDGKDNHDPGTAGPCVPAPGITASSAVMTALTVAAGRRQGAPAEAERRVAARTVLPPTTWATRPLWITVMRPRRRPAAPVP